MDDKTKKIKIHLTADVFKSKIFVEGKELENVRKIEVIADAGDNLTRVYVEFINVEVDIEGEAEVTTNQEEEEDG